MFVQSTVTVERAETESASIARPSSETDVDYTDRSAGSNRWRRKYFTAVASRSDSVVGTNGSPDRPSADGRPRRRPRMTGVSVDGATGVGRADDGVRRRTDPSVRVDRIGDRLVSSATVSERPYSSDRRCQHARLFPALCSSFEGSVSQRARSPWKPSTNDYKNVIKHV